MPTVQYIHNGKQITKQMLTPKKITSVQHWFKEARKTIQEIPDALINVFSESGWCITWHEVDLKWLKFDLEDRQGNKAYIVILRKS